MDIRKLKEVWLLKSVYQVLYEEQAEEFVQDLVKLEEREAVDLELDFELGFSTHRIFDFCYTISIYIGSNSLAYNDIQGLAGSKVGSTIYR